MRWLALDTWMKWDGRLGSRDCGDVWPDDYQPPPMDPIAEDYSAADLRWREGPPPWDKEASALYHLEYRRRRLLLNVILSPDVPALVERLLGPTLPPDLL